MTGIRLIFVGTLVLSWALPVRAIVPAKTELAAASSWRHELFGTTDGSLPLSFSYGGKRFSDGGWVRKRTDGGLSFVDPSGTVEATVEIREYPGFPAFSWLLRFRNVSTRRSKVISAVRPIDFCVPSVSKGAPHVIHHAAGAMQSLDDYQQRTTLLSDEWWRQHTLRIRTEGGRACQAAWPYFNLETPDAGAGLIVAIGWAGQWEAEFNAGKGGRLRMSAGMSDSNFYLEPGETVRGPSAVVLLYRRGDWIEGQNLWRQWFLAYNTPRQNGRIVGSQTMCSLCDGTTFGSDEMSAASMKRFIDGYAARGFTFDYWWIDAAWYQWKNQWIDGKTKKPHWRWTGNWVPDPVRFPNGPGEVFAYAKEKCGAKGGILWFEIERVVPSAPVAREHPEWLYPEFLPESFRGRGLNLGSEGGWKWAFETVDGTLRREGADFFRLDFNYPPLWFWRRADRLGGERNRAGISEMKHVDGFYRLYDAVLKADPSRRIDNCAQGGCRNDVESLSYSVPLWRTDTSRPVDEQQMQTAGISLWVPLYGGGRPATTDVYELRSRLQPYLHLGVNAKTEGDWSRLKDNLTLWRRYCAPYYVKDFYPLTRSDAGADLWCAWEFVDPEKGTGFVQAFRRAETTSATFIVRPRGLDAAKRYVFEDIDTHETWTVPGDGAFEIRCPRPRTAKILSFYPAENAPVAVLNDAMRAFVTRPLRERIGLLQDPAFRAAAVKAGSRPEPFVLKVPGAGENAALELRRAADRTLVGRFPVKGGGVTIDNLEVAVKYVWRAMSGGTVVADGSFVTEDGVPRICRIAGVGNVRDFGGRVVEDGRRVRQGRLYRSAAFNATAVTNGDRSTWRPGKTFLSEASRRAAMETFGFKTDLDLRSQPECFGLTESPLGADVRWIRVSGSNYGRMRDKSAREAFARAFRVVNDPDNHPVVFHCVGGADRTGSFAWLLGGILGERLDDLYSDWELTVFNYTPLKFNHWNFIGGLTRLLDELYPDRTMQAQCVAYAKDCGISDDEIAAFRALMLE